MRKKYESPKARVILLHGPALMLGGSNSVNDYNRGSDFTVGDTDEPSSVKSNNYVDWGN
mgnify:CR=1 FL=1